VSTDTQNRDSIFLRAIDIAESERAAFIAEACGDDDEVRREVSKLVAAHFQAGSFLENAAVAPAAAYAPDAAGNPDGENRTLSREGVGTLIGPYKLVQQIGEGGMGTVWMAQQTEPVRRLVALKVIKPGMDSRQVIARFEAERQALAMMDHNNIAKVLEAGTTVAGLPYFVMELVKGVPITRYCDEHRLSLQQRLELLIVVCQAIQHAHQKGIIHRDIKPSNVLVCQYDDDGKPVPKVIDFGIAKATGQQLTERTLVTGFGAVVGTLEYMSPEQAELNQLDIDTRSDVYSLGVLLYELLTGSTPLERKRLCDAAMLEVLRLIREEEPPKPSTRLSTSDELPSVAANRGLESKKLSGLVRGELDWIVMKALEKDRNRRYETPNSFAADVQRYLADEPVQACPPSASYRFRKFARRNKAALATAVLVTAVLLMAAVVGGGTWQWWAQKRAGAESEARAALREATGLLDEERWAEALSAARRAEGILVGGVGADPDLRRQARTLVEDLEMARRLQEARLQAGAVMKDGHFNPGAADKAYATAFQEYGLDIDGLDPKAAAEQIRTRYIQWQLVAALDDWALTQRALKSEGWKRRLAVARVIDPDVWRNHLRDFVEAKNGKTLEEEVAAGPAGDWPVPTLVLLGTVASRTASGERVAALLRQAQQRHPDDFWINETLGVVLFHQARPPRLVEAIRFYSVAVGLQPQSPGAHLNLGTALDEEGQLDEAIAEFHEAIRLKNDYADAHSMLGQTLMRKGRLDEAIVELREAIRLTNDDPETHSMLGNALMRKGRLDEAIAEGREAIRLKKDLAEAHFNLGAALAEKGLLEEAIAEYRETLRLKPDLTGVHITLGALLCDQKHDYDGAIAAFREALRLNKGNADAHRNLGNAFMHKGQLDEAIAEYRETVRLKEDNAEARCGLGLALRRKGQLDEAVDQYREAIRLKPDLVDAHNNLGALLCDAKHDYDGAIIAFREALRLNKDNAVAHYNLANALSHKEGQLDEAIAEYREAIRLKEDYAAAHCMLGMTLVKKGRFREAVEELRRGNELGSHNPRWPYPSEKWLHNAEVLADLDSRLPELLKGQAQPKDTAERLALAQGCQQPFKALYAASSRFYGEAFTQQASLADDLKAGHRYNAACAAALAGCGQGKDAADLPEKERAGLRKQALDWLRAETKAYRQMMEKSADKTGPEIAQRMQHWLQDTDFRGVRGHEAMGRLPEEERGEWQKLWAEVEALRQRAAKLAKPGDPVRP
jgi:serine/threonine protein kinase/Flp pilus assembly protein TadD